MTLPNGARQWSATLTAALDEVADHLDAVSRRLADAWPDVRGEEWAHRVRVLRGAVQRDAGAALEFGREVDRLTGPEPGGPQLGGPLLGGTGAVRVDDSRGVTIPRLNGG